MQILVLGQIEAIGDRAMPLGGPTQRRLLGVLALHHDQVVSTDRLIDFTWPEEDRPSRAERNVHTYISRLRGSLDGAGDRIQTVGGGYRLHLESGELDLERFDELAAAARRHANAGDHVAALAAIDDALALWNGPPFGEFGDEPWAVADGTRAVETQVALRELRAELLLETGRPVDVVADAEALAREHPYRETPRALLMQALYHAGRQAEALRAFQAFRRVLIDEVGVEPSSSLVDLDRRIAASSLDEPAGESARTIGSYVLGERIGEGAFAVVYRAHQPTLDRDVAVKVVRAELANRPEFVRRFEAEAQMVARIEHPNVVPLYDYWREPDRAYLVMRLMTGGTLEQRLDSGAMPMEAAVGVVEQVAAALSAAHDLGVVHRDVKPENIMFDAEGRAFLTDFGIALDAAERARPEAALSEGSPLFASPEQLRREPVGPEADVHALGVVAYTMLVGRPPFADAPDEVTLLRRQLDEPIPTVAATRPQVPEAVDRVLAIATAKHPADRYPSARSFAIALAAAVTSGVEPTGAVRIGDRTNPYKGLRAFDETDAADFHGRERLVDELLESLAQHDERLLAVVGPSGSGKSSVVRAGLVPALRTGRITGSQDWFTTSMTPGTHPFEALETSLLRVAVNPPGSLLDQLRSAPRGILRGVRRVLPDDQTVLLVVIDQFEELFTGEIDPVERDLFLDALVVAANEPGSPLRVVVTLRADFFDRPLRHPSFAPLLKRRTIAVAPLAPDELEHAIVDPANSVGVGFEAGVVARIVAEVSSQPGALPLLQYALTRAFDRAEGDTITEADYEAIGGLTGSLAGRAEELWAAADAGEQAAIRRLFERLVHLGEGVQDTRRRVELSELGSDAATAAALRRFGDARLLTFDRHPATREPTVEVAHEALIQQWPRLREWLDADRDALRAHRHLTTAAAAWIDRGRDRSDLYRGARLEAAEQLVDAGRLDLNDDEGSFLAASVAQRDDEVRVARRRTVRLRRFASAAALLAVVAVVAGVVAFVQRERADDSRQLAEESAATARDEAARADAESQVARIRELAASAQSVRDRDPELAMLLALEAIDAGEGTVLPEAEQALHEAVLSTRLEARLPAGFDGVADFFPDGDSFIALDGESAVVHVWEVDPPRVRMSLTAPDAWIADAAVSPDGDRVVAGDYEGRAWVWDAATGELERELVPASGDDIPSDDILGLIPVFSNDGRMVALSWEGPGPDGEPRGFATVWDVDNGEELYVLEAPEGLRPLNVEFSPDDRHLAVSMIRSDPDADQGIRMWDLDSGELVRTFRGGHTAEVRDMGFTPDGGRLVTASFDSTVRVFDVETAEELGSYEGHDGVVWDVEISQDGTVVASSGTEVHLWELDTLAPLDVNVFHADVDGLALSPDGTTLVTSSGADRSTRVWDVTATGRRESLAVPGPEAGADSVPGAVKGSVLGGVAIAPDGTTLAANLGAGGVGVWSLDSGDELATLAGPGSITDITYSHDGALLAATGVAGVTVWSTDPYEVVTEIWPDRPAEDVEFRPDGRALLVSGLDGMHEYEITAGGVSGEPSIVHTDAQAFFARYRPGTTDIVRAYDISDAEAEIFVELADGRSGRWVEDLLDSGGEGTDVLERMVARPREARFDANGEVLLLAGDSGMVVLDGTDEFAVLAIQDDHDSTVWDAELSPDGTEAATVGGDGTIRIWEARTGITRLVLPSGGANDLAYSPDGRRLAAMSPNGATTVFLLDVDELVAEAQSRLTRTWTTGECEQYRLGDECLALAAAAEADTTGDDTTGDDTDGDDTEGDDQGGDDAEDEVDVEAEAERDAPAAGGAASSSDAADRADDLADVEPADDATALALAERFVAAMDAHDVDAADDLVTSDAIYDVHYTDWGTDLALVFGWLDAADWRFESQGCEVVEAGRVRCAVDQRNAWSEVFSGTTAPGTVNLTVGVDGIVAVRYEFDQLQWIDVATFPFFGFVAEIDEADAEALFDTSIGIPRPYPTPETVDLFRRYTQELVAAHGS